MERKNLRVGDLVVISGCKVEQFKSEVGKIGKIVRFVSKGYEDEDFCDVTEDAVVIEALYGEYKVVYEDDTIGTELRRAIPEKFVEFVA